ncbi:MAG TPA: hypothetical protein PKN85_04180 [Syntrophorhabdaceae bacterium]|nr:hypothetical protein [Syntrophorhabdaceae bacterium]
MKHQGQCPPSRTVPISLRRTLPVDEERMNAMRETATQTLHATL